MFKTILEVRDISVARVLIIALKAHGFHPLESDMGVSGFPGITNIKGTIAIKVPEHEVENATILGKDLLEQMDI